MHNIIAEDRSFRNICTEEKTHINNLSFLWGCNSLFKYYYSHLKVLLLPQIISNKQFFKTFWLISEHKIPIFYICVESVLKKSPLNTHAFLPEAWSSLHLLLEIALGHSRSITQAIVVFKNTMDASFEVKGGR